MVVILTLLSASLPALLASQQVAANPDFGSGALRQLFTRQGSTPSIDPSLIPSQCQKQCSPLVTAMQGCTDISCICSDKNADLLAGCFNCALTIPNAPVTQAQAQAAYDQFADGCRAAGVTVKSETIKAGSSGGSGSSSGSGSGSSNGGGSGLSNGAIGRSAGIVGLLGVILGVMVVLV